MKSLVESISVNEALCYSGDEVIACYLAAGKDPRKMNISSRFEYFDKKHTEEIMDRIEFIKKGYLVIRSKGVFDVAKDAAKMYKEQCPALYELIEDTDFKDSEEIEAFCDIHRFEDYAEQGSKKPYKDCGYNVLPEVCDYINVNK